MKNSYFIKPYKAYIYMFLNKLRLTDATVFKNDCSNGIKLMAAFHGRTYMINFKGKAET